MPMEHHAEEACSSVLVRTSYVVLCLSNKYFRSLIIPSNHALIDFATRKSQSATTNPNFWKKCSNKTTELMRKVSMADI